MNVQSMADVVDQADFDARNFRAEGHRATTARLFAPRDRTAAVVLLDEGQVFYWTNKERPERRGKVPWIDCIYCGRVHIMRASTNTFSCNVASFIKLVVNVFPSLRSAPHRMPWDAKKFASWVRTSPAVTSGSNHAGRFVLAVWGGGSWPSLPFDLVRAWAVWDTAHQAAFLTWTKNPYRP